ncbi:MAG TPA: hypothetical protein VEO95_09870 [Chthoniobacteraceae bacterium]|nr:hypothetical protein [Chthoniobacteraceae bacterium]
MSYRYSLADSALKVFSACATADRDRLIRLFETIARAPEFEADVDGLRIEGRECMVKCSADWVVTYWLDFPIREVRIVALDRAP